jgi:hypothetical protein
MLARHRRIRPWRAFAYFLLALGGLIILWDPTRNVQPVPWAIRWIWSLSIILPALLSMVGALLDRWRYEFASLPLIAAGFSVLVWLLVAGGGQTGRLAFACWIASIVVQTARRWFSLWKFNNALRRAKRKGAPNA